MNAPQLIRRRRQRRNGRFSPDQPLKWVATLLVTLLVLTFSLILLATLAVATLTAVFYPPLAPFSTIQDRWASQQGSTPTTLVAVQDDALIPLDTIQDPLGDERRWLTADELPDILQQATVATQDPTFWEHDGFAPSSGWLTLLTNQPAPTTITQRLVTDQLLTSDRLSQTTPRLSQLNQRLLVQQVEESYSKEQLLAWYLNSTSYGNFAFGTEAASRVYFGKRVGDLTLAEVALLVSLPHTTLDPFTNPAAAKAAQEQTLDQLADAGLITSETAVSTKQLPLTYLPPSSTAQATLAPHFTQLVRQELLRRFGPEQLLLGGLTVHTTLDLALQQQADCVAQIHLAQLAGTPPTSLPADLRAACRAADGLPAAQPNGRASETAVVLINPATGHLLALTGGTGRDLSQNLAADPLHEPAATLHPFIYLTALSQGYSAATMVLDVPTTFGDPAQVQAFTPPSDGHAFLGPLRLRQAFANALTVPAIQVLSWIGVEQMLDTAHSLGLTSMAREDGRYGLSLPVSGGNASLLDLTYAYSVFANGGIMAGQLAVNPIRPLDPILIERVEDADGNLIFEPNRTEREILAPALAFLLNDMLADRNARCLTLNCPTSLELPDSRPAAVQVAQTATDSWTIGYTPQLAIGVWLGNPDETPADLSALVGAAPVWQALLAHALETEPIVRWEQPADLVETAVCELSGLLPTPHCPTVSELFIPGTTPTSRDAIFQPFTINRETGRLATVSTPPNLLEERIYRVYPEAAAAWAAENGLEQPPTEFDTLSINPEQDTVALLSPEPFAIVGGDTLQILGQINANRTEFDQIRLAYFAGLSPAPLTVITQTAVFERNRAVPLADWELTGLEGVYTLLLTAVRPDTTFAEVSLPLTIDQTPPTAEIRAPFPNQTIPLDNPEGGILIQVIVSDNIAPSRVRFFANDEEIPFAVDNSLPFTQLWESDQPGCTTLTVEPIDEAGNVGERTAVVACLSEQ